eukprot:1741694-Pyramimonas_sp.AAC.1
MDELPTVPPRRPSHPQGFNEDVVLSVGKWLHDAELDNYTVVGDAQDKLFTIQFNGAAGTAGKKVAQALAALRLPGEGQWM